MATADLIAIRMRLFGGDQVAGESRRAAAGIGMVGAAGRAAGTAVRDTTTGIRNSIRDVASSSRRMRDVGRGMTYGLTLPLLGAGYAAVKTAASFDTSMRQVQVATGVGAQGLEELRALAIQMGKDTIFSANDSADAILELSKGGMSAAQIKAGALTATMALAAAGGIELADAATQVVGSMNAFNLTAADSNQIANALAGAAIASSADLGDLSQAFQQASAQASAAGWSVQETAAALALLADNGIRGSDAGTSLRTFLQRLNPQTEKARGLMAELGLEFYDSAGRMKSFAGVTGELREGLKGMTDEQRAAALQTLFGSDAVRAANIIYGAGAGEIRKYLKATNDQTAAEKMAEARMKGLTGALEKLRGSLETAALAAGVALTPIIIFLAGAIGWLADKFTNLPGPVQTVIVGFLLFAAVAGPAIFAAGALAAAATALGISLGTLLIAAGVVGLVIALGVAFLIAYHRVGWFRKAVDSTWDFIKDKYPLLLIVFGPIVGAVIALARSFGKAKRDAISAFEWIKNAAKNAARWVVGAWNGVGGKIGAGWGIAKSMAIGAINGIIDAINWVIDKVDDLPGVGNLSEIGHIGGSAAAAAGSSPEIARGTTGSGGRGQGRSTAAPAPAIRRPTLPPARSAPALALAGAGGSGSGERRIVLQVGRRVLAEITADEFEDEEARR